MAHLVGALDDREVINDLLHDPIKSDQEFETRFLANRPNWVIGGLLWVSETRHRAVHDGVNLTRPRQVLPMDAIFWRDPYALVRR